MTLAKGMVAMTWEPPKCSSIDDRTKRRWYYRAIRKDEILPLATTRVDLENIMLKEISQTEKNQEPYDFTHVWI